MQATLMPLQAQHAGYKPVMADRKKNVTLRLPVDLVEMYDESASRLGGKDKSVFAIAAIASFLAKPSEDKEIAISAAFGEDRPNGSATTLVESIKQKSLDQLRAHAITTALAESPPSLLMPAERNAIATAQSRAELAKVLRLIAAGIDREISSAPPDPANIRPRAKAVEPDDGFDSAQAEKRLHEGGVAGKIRPEPKGKPYIADAAKPHPDHKPGRGLSIEEAERRAKGKGKK